jgi:hypothetical protein
VVRFKYLLIMATTVLNIKSVTWGSNPLNVQQSTILSIYITKSVTDLIKCLASGVCCGNILCGII